MQESLEDYIRISRNIKTKGENENIKIKEELLATAERKKECEAYAMKIVMFLLEGKLRSEIFLKCLKYINQEYYQDVVEERAITNICGYPLCGKKIPEMPKQKYFISTKVNKVYDVSERKNYCSNFCYKASIHVKNQVDTSPLWLRNYAAMLDCKLLPETTVCVPGEEIDQGIAKADSESPAIFTSISEFTQLSLEEAEEMERSSKKCKIIPVKTKVHQKPQCSLDVIKEDDDCVNDSEHSDFEFHESSDEECSYNNVKRNAENIAQKLTSTNSPKENLLFNDHKNKKVPQGSDKLEYLISKLKNRNEAKTILIEPPPMKLEPKNKGHESKTILKTAPIKQNISRSIRKESCKIIESNRDSSHSEILNNVKTCVEEWITIDTLIFIYGEVKVKGILNEKKMGEHFDKLKIAELETAQQLEYMNMCRRLHMQELAEEKFDNAILGHNLKALPDFKDLKEEVRDHDIKVKSFYTGVLYEKPDTNFPTKPVKEYDDEPVTVLPLVDACAQNALRQKIFLNSISKSLKRVISEIQIDESSTLSNVHDLVKSFKLQAHNTLFKATIWPLIAIILLKMLSLKDTNIEKQLQEQSSLEYLELILSEYIGVDSMIDDIFSLFGDMDKFVEYYIKHGR